MIKVLVQYKTKLLSRFFLLIAGLLFSCSLYSKEINFEHIDNLPSKDILDVVKDKYGFIWIAHESGIVRYDGYDFVEYDIRDDNINVIGLEAVWHVYIDKNDVLWIGGGNGGCAKYNYEEENFINYSTYNENEEPLIYVKSITEDKSGTLWVGGLGGIYYYDEEEDMFKSTVHISSEGEELGAVVIKVIYVHDDGILWLGDGFRNIFLYNVDTKELIRYKEGFFKERIYESNNIFDIYKDSNGYLWVSGEHVAVKIDPRTNEQESFEDKIVNVNKTTYTIEDLEGNIWFSAGGLSVYNPNTGEVKYIVHNDHDSRSLSSNITNKIYIDNQGVFWIGTWYGGMNIYNSSKKFFVQKKSILCDETTISNNTVHCFYEDKYHNIWVGTEDGILNKYNSEDGTFKHYHDPGMIVNEAITGIVAGNKDELILGTWGSLKIFNTKTGKFKRLLENVRIPSLMAGDNNNIWFGVSNEGLLELNLNNYKTINHTKEAIGTCYQDIYFLRNISKDSFGNIWVVAWAAIAKYNVKEKCFYKVAQSNTDSYTLPYGQVYCCYQDSKGRIWIGHTKGIGLYNIKEDYLLNFGENYGMKGAKVNAIVEDDDGNLWLSTDKGISKFCLTAEVTSITKDSAYVDSLPDDFIYFYNYNEDDGVRNERFLNGNLKTQNGEIYFGGVKGINIFNPKEILPDTIKSPIRFIELLLFNKVVRPRSKDNPDSPLEKSIVLTNSLTLNYNQYIFSLRWAALNYYSTNKVEYKYIMEGLDKDWNYIGNKRTAHFTSLPSGEYTLRVKATNSDGIWSDEEASIKIIILPPWWDTWWFRILGVLFILSLVIIFIRIRLITLTRQKKILQKAVDDKTHDLQKANAAKDKFFSIIAHDLRNPFNIILGYSDLLLRNYSAYEEKDRLDIYSKINRVTEKTYNLLENLLTWSRAELGSIEYKPEEINTKEYISNNILMLKDAADKKNISLHNNAKTGLYAKADLNAIDTILRNLINNAIKFTPRNGTISIATNKITCNNKSFIQIIVEDNGVGMTKGKAKSLFKSGNNISTKGTEKEDGSGLGLMLCKEFAIKNGGRIWVESEESVGSKFIFTLPDEHQS